MEEETEGEYANTLKVTELNRICIQDDSIKEREKVLEPENNTTGRALCLTLASG